jgi:Co/Zn/Cd efflux system component
VRAIAESFWPVMRPTGRGLLAEAEWECAARRKAAGIVQRCIAHWSLGLLRTSGAVLLDVVPNDRLANEIRRRLESGTDRVADLHVWRLGPGHAGVIATIVADQPEAPESYKSRLSDLPGLSHVTIEVHTCPGGH